MRVLLDECVPRRLAQFFGSEHSVATVTGLGWAGTTNGELLRLAADRGFEAFVTVDVDLHVPPDVPMRVLVLRAGSNRLETLLPLMPSAPIAGRAAARPHRDYRRQASSMTIITAPMLGPVAEPAPTAVSLFVPADTTDAQLVVSEEFFCRGRQSPRWCA